MKKVSDLFIKDYCNTYRELPSFLKSSCKVLFLFIFVLAILEVMSIFSLSFLAMSVTAPEAAVNHKVSRFFIDLLPHDLGELVKTPRNFIVFASFSVVILTLTKNTMSMFVASASGNFGGKVSLYIGKTFFENFLFSPFLWHLSESRELLTNINKRHTVGRFIVLYMNLYTYFITSSALLILMASSVPFVIILFFGMAGTTGFLIYRNLKGKVGKATKESRIYDADENIAINHSSKGIIETILYKQQPVFLNHFLNASRKNIKPTAFLSFSSNIPPWILEIVGFSLIPMTATILISYYEASLAEVAQVLTMLMLVCWRILPLFNRSVGILIQTRRLEPDVVSALDCLKKVKKFNLDIDLSDDNQSPFKFKNSIDLKDISFSYPDSDQDVFSDINISIKKGSRVGIIGRSGVGKSTLAAIICGLIDPSRGEVLIDGDPLTNAQKNKYRKSIGYVAQPPYILAGTVAENISFSQWSKEYDEKKIIEACKLAELDVIETKKGGIHMHLGEGGIGLSGGQVQRVSIARALYTNPQILILDEATSALDHATESRIMDTLYGLPQNISIIIIAHRLSTVERCDKIIWMDEGKIRMEGSPSIVLKKYTS